jgi:hypothetical protein
MAAGGCGQRLEYGQVAGRVHRDQMPLADVLVTFVPEDSARKLPRAMGVTDAAGRFQLHSEDGQAGAVVGKHRVVFEDLSIQNAPRSDDGTLLERPVPRFPPQYAELLKTPVVREVQPGAQELDLSLE